MIYRPFNVRDFDQIQELYRKRLNINMYWKFYQYLYKTETSFCSWVCELDRIIVAHTGLIPKKYLCNKNTIKVALVSGVMVSEKHPGLFYRLIRKMMKEFKGDAIIGFPNKNSNPFFTRLLGFNSIYQNYFTLTRNNINYKFNGYFLPTVSMTPKNILYRIEKHPYNTYHTMEVNKLKIIYKKYRNSIDLIYTSFIDSQLIKCMEILFDSGYKNINIINSNSAFIKSIGFKESKNNIFVYKWITKKYSDLLFDCQMIDSDVF